MTFAMLYADTGDIIGMYESRDAALRDLAAYVGEHPESQDDVGLRPYEGGLPAGDFEPATALVADSIRQPHLI